MFEINKQEFGAFVAQLRKEKGYTQKELASQLFISDKAVSKWESGVSIPDTALLVPLSELLGVSVTELLMGKRMEETPLDSDQVESIVKAAISYQEEAPTRAWQAKGKWALIYVSSLLLGFLGLYLCSLAGAVSESALTCTILGAVFGAYFCFWARLQLPDYYDKNRISGVMDGPFRMNIPGVSFNNRNWPHIILVGKIWSCAAVGLFPLLCAALGYFASDFWAFWGDKILLVLTLGGLFLPVYWVAKKYA